MQRKHSAALIKCRILKLHREKVIHNYLICIIELDGKDAGPQGNYIYAYPHRNESSDLGGPGWPDPIRSWKPSNFGPG